MKSLYYLLTLFLSFSFSCSKESIPRNRLLRIAVPGQPANLDPNKSTDAISGMMLMQIHEGLTVHDQNLKVEPALASAWDFNSDYTQITYHLRENLKWSDGSPLNAHDFEYGWKRLLNPDTAAEYAYFLFDIKGAEDYNSGKGTAENVGIHAIDDNTLRIDLKRPAPYFPHISTFMVTYPIPKKVVEKAGDNWTEPEHIIVSGPFKPIEHIHEYRMRLVPNPHWALGKQGVDRLEIYMTAEKTTALNLFVAGNIDIVFDMLPIAIPSYRKNKNYFNGPKLEVRYIGIRIDDPAMKDNRVRRALAMAIQREDFPKVLKGGEIPTEVWIPDGMFGYAPNTGIPFNPDEAKKLMAEAGFPDGKGFPDITLLFRAGDDWQLIAQNVQQQWKHNLGIKINIQVREQKAFFQEIGGKGPPPMHLARWIADFPDPENFMGLFKSNSGNNSLAFANTSYDKLVNDAVLTDDPKIRFKAYEDAQKILVIDEIAMIPIYTGAQNILRKPELENLYFNAMGDARLGKVKWSTKSNKPKKSTQTRGQR